MMETEDKEQGKKELQSLKRPVGSPFPICVLFCFCYCLFHYSILSSNLSVEALAKSEASAKEDIPIFQY
jgi:hypothetical protein